MTSRAVNLCVTRGPREAEGALIKWVVNAHVAETVVLEAGSMVAGV